MPALGRIAKKDGMSDAIQPPRRDLPPVTPPSGRFIAQLFLVPGLIVLCVVLLLLAIQYMFVGGQSADQFLVSIDSTNPDIRWRGANDLAQSLARKENVPLRTNVTFALDLCERLDTAIAALDKEEAAIAAGLPKNADPAKAYGKLEAQRNLVNFLARALGDFLFPAGVPQLAGMIQKEPGPDLIGGTTTRRQALWSLANLGNTITGFKDLKPQQQELVLAKLHQEETSPKEIRRRAAKNALYYLKQSKEKDADIVAIDEALDVASRAQDQYLREMVAHSLNFWDGPKAEEILIRLSGDNGFGTLIRTPEEP